MNFLLTTNPLYTNLFNYFVNCTESLVTTSMNVKVSVTTTFTNIKIGIFGLRERSPLSWSGEESSYYDIAGMCANQGILGEGKFSDTTISRQTIYTTINSSYSNSYGLMQSENQIDSLQNLHLVAQLSQSLSYSTPSLIRGISQNGTMSLSNIYI